MSLGLLYTRKKAVIFFVCLCAILMILGVISWKLLFPSYDGDGAVTAKIYQEGTLLYTIPLYKVQHSYELSIVGENGGENTILVSKGEISVSQADCPDQVCVKRGIVSYSGIPIVCMPNQLVIQFEKGGELPETDTEIS